MSTSPEVNTVKETSSGLMKKLLDVKEAKQQALFALPMILTTAFYCVIPIVSVMYAGHLGSMELAGATLANSWATVTGFAFMVGLSGSLETLCGQGFGAESFRMLGLTLQASCVISFFFSIIISFLWFYTEPILVLLRQDPDISKQAGSYIKYLIPGLFAYGFIQNTMRFLQTQSVVFPLVLLSGIPMAIHFGIAYTFVHWTSLGFKGASLATSVSIWIGMLLIVSYVLLSKKFKQTWEGFSFESFSFILTSLKLALPSAAMVLLQSCAFEMLVFLAGLMPNPKLTTSIIAMCVNTALMANMITFGLSATASTRVSNELGAGNIGRAKSAMATTMKLSIALALVVVISLAAGHDIWAGLFSDSREIIEAFTSMAPFLGTSMTIDSVQGVLSGVARACGWQHLAALINLGTFYCIGMPIGVVLGFKLKLYAKGLWIGLICGISCQVIALLSIALCKTWTKLDVTENTKITETSAVDISA